MEGPTADTDEKGGCPMSHARLLSFRKEVRDYMRSCEYLLATAGKHDDPPFTPDERGIVAYYQAEIGKILAPLGQQQ